MSILIDAPFAIHIPNERISSSLSEWKFLSYIMNSYSEHISLTKNILSCYLKHSMLTWTSICIQLEVSFQLLSTLPSINNYFCLVRWFLCMPEYFFLIRTLQVLMRVWTKGTILMDQNTDPNNSHIASG